MAYFVAFGRQDDDSARSRVIAVLVACFIVANLGWSLATVNWNRGNDVLMSDAVDSTTCRCFACSRSQSIRAVL